MYDLYSGRLKKIYDSIDYDEIVESLPKEEIVRESKENVFFTKVIWRLNQLREGVSEGRSTGASIFAKAISFLDSDISESFFNMNKFFRELPSELKSGKKIFFSKPVFEDLIEQYNFSSDEKIFEMLKSAFYDFVKFKQEKGLFLVSFVSKIFSDFFSDYKIEIGVLEALSYHTFGSDLSDLKWRSTLDYLKEYPSWDRMGESSSIVKRLSGNKFLNLSLVFKESDCLDDLIAERDMNYFISKNCDVETPTPFFIADKGSFNDSNVFVMGYCSGFLLTEMVGSYHEFIFEYLSKLSLIHSSVPIDMVRFGKIDLTKEIKKRINNEYLNFSPEIKNSISSWYDVSIPFFEKYDELWKYNLDSHPENIIVRYAGLGKQVAVIDTENKYVCPLVFDLANLLGYGNYFSKKEMKKFVKFYYGHFKEENSNLSINYENFELLYWNALIHRSFFLCSAWSSPKRKSLHPKRVDLVNNVLMAIDVLRYDFNEFYKESENIYKNLECAFKIIKENLDNS